ncbi:MAG: hypothetical protein AAF434_17250 [Pseudomonadota bacterium]
MKNNDKKDLETELLKVIKQYRTIGVSDELTQQREDALKRYFGDKDFLPTLPGRSKLVTRDVMEVVEWAAADMVRVFTSSDDAVAFVPEGQEDEAQAEQESDYVNYVLNRDNNGFLIHTQAIKDGLLSKNGVVKAWWDESEEVTQENYEGLTEFQVMELTKDEELELGEAQVEMVPVDQFDPASGRKVGAIEVPFYDIEATRTRKRGKIKIAVIPPEHFFYDHLHPDLDLSDCRFVGDKVRVTVSDLHDMGFSKESIDRINDGDEQDSLETGEYQERHGEIWDKDSDADQSSKVVWLEEYYIKYDTNDDGKSETVQVHAVQDVILSHEVVDRNPYHAWTPIIVPHRFDGLSMDDVAGDLQDSSTTMLRQAADNIYQTNHSRPVIGSGVNIEDVISPAPNRPIRVKGDVVGQFMPNPVQPIAQGIFQAMEYLSAQRSDRTGIDKSMQAIDPELLKQTTQGAYAQATNLAGVRKDGMVRTYAETLLKSLTQHIHELARKHQDVPRMMKLRNEWVEVNPTEWKDRYNMIVNVGLGTNDRDMRAAQLGSIMQMQFDRLLQLRLASPLEIRNTFNKYVEALGFKDVDNFSIDPRKLPPPQPQPDPNMIMLQIQERIEQGKLQVAAMKNQNDARLTEQKQNLEAQIKRWQMELEYHKQNSANQQAAIDDDREERRLGMDAAVHDEKLDIEWAKLNKSPTGSGDSGINMTFDTSNGVTSVDKLSDQVDAVAGAVKQGIGSMGDGIKEGLSGIVESNAKSIEVLTKSLNEQSKTSTKQNAAITQALTEIGKGMKEIHEESRSDSKAKLELVEQIMKGE